MTDTPSTWDGIVVNFDNLEGYAWYNTIITVNSNPYRLLHGYMVAGLREMDATITEFGGKLTATSSTSATIGTGSQALTVETGKGFAAGQIITAYQTDDSTNYMVGTVDSYNSDTGALTFTVASGDTGGSGTIAAWTVAITGKKGDTGTDGTMAGPESSTDNAVARFDGTGGSTVQNSPVLIDDSGNVAGVVALTMSGTLTAGEALFQEGSEWKVANTSSPSGVSGTQAAIAMKDASEVWIVANGDVTQPISAPTSGYKASMTLILEQDATGGRAFTITDGSTEGTWIGAEPSWGSLTGNTKTWVSAIYRSDGSLYLSQIS